MKRYWLIGIVSVFFTPLVDATTLERDLGRGLVYMRVAQVPDDLPVRSQAPAIVLDLRYASGEDIREWLFMYAAPQTPIFVLANMTTQKTLRQSMQGVSGSITIGIAGEDFAPDIALNMTEEEEKRAYEALNLTDEINTLLYPATHKERYDEAAMVKACNETRKTVTEPQADAQAAAPITDQAILRAVQIHRGWLVLRSG